MKLIKKKKVMSERRGRPIENSEPILKYTQIFEDGDGGKQIWIYDKTKNPFGPMSVEIKYPKQYKTFAEEQEELPATKRKYCTEKGKWVGYQRAKALGII